MLDRRFVLEGKVPSTKSAPNLGERFWLSIERGVYIKFSSPHERGQSLKEFCSHVDKKISKGARERSGATRRWNFAGALQPDAVNKMPNLEESVVGFSKFFQPERIRVAILEPDRHRNSLRTERFLQISERLAYELCVELVRIDARKKHGNGQFLADFFDFT